MNKILLLPGLMAPFLYLRFFGFPIGAFELALILASFYLFLKTPKLNFKNEPFFTFGVALLGLGMIIGAVLATDKLHALAAFLLWFLLPLLFSILISNKLKEQRFFALGLNFGLLIVFAWALLQRFGLLGAVFWQENVDQYLKFSRAVGPFNSPNLLGMYALPAGILAAYYASPKQRFFPLIPALLILFLAFSKGAILAAILGGLATLFITFVSKQNLKIAFGGVLITLILAFLFATFGSLRKEIWIGALALLKENPLLGIGFDNFAGRFSERFASSINSNYILPYAIHPHNLVLALLLNSGILGLLGFFTLWTRAVNKTILGKRPLLLWALLAIMIHGLADTTFFGSLLALLTLLPIVEAETLSKGVA